MISSSLPVSLARNWSAMALATSLSTEDVGHFAINGIGPKMGISCGFNQLHIYAHGVAALLHTSLQNVSDAEFLRDLGYIFRSTFIMLCRGARDHLQISYPG